MSPALTFMRDPLRPLAEAVRALSARCDGAHTLDGSGFNGTDAKFGNRLADLDVALWTPAIAREAWEMLAKYRRQLESAGIDYDRIPVPMDTPRNGGLDSPRQQARRLLFHAERRAAAGVPLKSARSITVEGDSFVIDFAYDPALVAAVKALPGRRFDGDRKCWTVPLLRAPQVAAFAAEHGFTADDEAESVLEVTPLDGMDAYDPRDERMATLIDGHIEVRWAREDPHFDQIYTTVKSIEGRHWDQKRGCWTIPATPSAARQVQVMATVHDFKVAGLDEIEHMAATAERMRAMSRAAEGSIEIPGFNGTLRPFQAAGVRYAIETRRLWIADEMGLGKTWQGLATLEALNAFPAIIVVPASLKLNWQREARKLLPGRSIEVLSGGREQLGYTADVTILNYDIIGKPLREDPDAPKKITGWKGHLPGLKAINPKALICDESHYVKGPKTIRTQAVLELAKDVDVRLLLSGTPVPNDPIELVPQLRILGRLKDFGGYRSFVSNYASAWGNVAARRHELNDRLRETCFVRRTKDQVLTELPPKVRHTLPMPIDNRAEYQRAEDALIQWIGQRAASDANFLAEIADLDDEAQKVAKADRRAEAEMRASRAEHLVRFNALKQLAAAGKRAGLVAWVHDFLDGSDQKLILFVHHKAEQEAVRAAFPGCASIAGGQSAESRQAAVDAFQNDPRVRLIVVSLMAGGVGLTLTKASNVAFVEFGWNPATHDQAEDRAHRIGQHDSVTCHYLVAPDTIDEEIMGIIEEKREMVTALVEGAEAAKARGDVETAQRLEAEAAEIRTKSVASDLVMRFVKRAEQR